MVITQHDIQQALGLLGLSGQAVCVHASLRSFGTVDGRATTLVRAFLNEHCTLLVPTFSWSFAVPPPADQYIACNGWKYATYPGPTAGVGRIYTAMTSDVDKDMGALATAVLAHPEHIRGNHPLCSFAALGPRAHEIITAQQPLDVYAPLTALIHLDGLVLLMGVQFDKLTLLHLAEKLAGRTLFRRWANAPTGTPAPVEVGGCSAGFPNLAPWLGPLTRTITVGQSVWQLLPARQAAERASAAIRANPEITRCGDPTCERCHDAVAGGPSI
jgi:aminoglycoside N3'-acetyltransferase